MSTFALAVCVISLISIVGVYALGRYVQARRRERARNAWLDRHSARAVEEARRSVNFFPWIEADRAAARGGSHE